MSASDDHPTIAGVEDLPPVRVGGPTLPGTHHCGAQVLTGWDDHLMALRALLDPYTLTPQLEAACLVLARPTYQGHGSADTGTFTIACRTWPGIPVTIKHPSANEVPVFAAHVCGKHLGGTPVNINSPPDEWPPPAPTDPF